MRFDRARDGSRHEEKVTVSGRGRHGHPGGRAGGGGRHNR